MNSLYRYSIYLKLTFKYTPYSSKNWVVLHINRTVSDIICTIPKGYKLEQDTVKVRVTRLKQLLERLKLIGELFPTK